MNEFVTSSAEPSYLIPLALTTAPFNQLDDSTFFFKSDQIEQRLNLLQHLIRASDKVALIFAEKGVGKSALLTQLQQLMSEDVRICRIDATSSASSEELTVHCLRAFGVDDNDIRLSPEHLELLQQRCFSLQNLSIKPLLLIDDADQLSESSLATILDWLSWRGNDQFLLGGVLTAENAMPELNTIHGRIQRIDLPVFAETELSAYLTHRLAVAGHQGKLPFKPKVLKQIFKKSAGKPELINQLAHQQLLGIKPVSASKTINLAGVFKWLGLGILTIVVILLLVFQDKINSLFSPVEDEVVLDQLSELVPEAPIAMVVADSEPTEMETIDEENSGLTAEEQERAELEALIAELPTPEPKEEAPFESEQSTSVESENISEKVTTIIESPATEAEVNSQEWTLRQNGNYYTFQLMGSWDEKKVVDFIEKYGVSGDVAIFQSMRNGQTWYALIYGVFESKDQALQASDAWPEKLRGLPKWLRRFDSVQQQIQK